MIYPSFGLEYELFHRGVKYIAGIDEVGRGPLAGPVVVGIVIINSQYYPIANVRDSKLLTEKQRNKLYHIIKSWVSEVQLGIISNKVIDKTGIQYATYKAAMQAYNKLHIKPDIVLADGKNIKTVPFSTAKFNKGDKLIHVISLASIIAKVYRDAIMTKYASIFPQYEFDKHKGYGTKQHIKCIKKYGLTPIHRLAFCSKI